jgi:hypothetical protein
VAIQASTSTERREHPISPPTLATRHRARAVIAAIGAALVLITGCGGNSQSGTTTSQPRTAPSHPSNWAAPLDTSAAAEKAGLPMLSQEMLSVHYHAHLDVIVDGQHITVPAQIGIDNIRKAISPLHSHDTTGIVHIESAKDIPFTLGQFFTEWGQPLTSQQVGPKTISSGEVLRVYRNGKPVAGDPAALKFQAHEEIAVWVGPSNATPHVPTSYRFPAGL